MISKTSSNAIYMEADGRLTVHQVDIDDRYKPQGSQTLVKVAYSAINPADVRHYHMGISDHIPGYDWVGNAVDVGPTSPFKVGQSLFGLTLLGNKRPITRGAHQDFLLAEAEWTWAVPSSMDSKQAAAFPAATMTSIDAIFNQFGFSLPDAGIRGDDATGKAILIWGAGSAVGQAGVQLAKAAGFSLILATASPRNHNFLKQLGADHCFDYHDADIVQQIRDTLAGQKLHVAYDTVGAGLGCFEGLSKEEEQRIQAQYHMSSPAIARRCCDGGEKLKLASVLVVPKDKDPEWLFPMPYRVPDGVGIPKVPGLESFFEGMDREWGNRMHKIIAWLLDDPTQRWRSPQLRVVNGAEKGIAAIQDVWAGKAGGQKVLIEHPM
jgi:NADPH:quinone reductase-like Zn-dependent oxidoreductase